MRVRVVIPKKKPAQVEDAQCQECHRKIVPDAITCPHCHAPIVRKYCPKCSQLIPEETTSCPLCGAAGNSRPKMDPQNLTTNILVIGGLGLLAIILFLSNREDATDKAALTSKPQKVQTETSKQETASKRTSPQESAGAILTRSDEEGARLNAIGHALIQEGKYEDAIEVLRLALRSFPEGSNSVAYKFTLYNLGHSLRRVGRPEEAVPVLRECKRLDNEWTKVVQELDLAQQAMDRKKLT